MTSRRLLSLILLLALLMTACRAPRPTIPASPLAPPASPLPTIPPTPPTLLEYSPPDGDLNLRLPTLRLAFSRPMDARSVLRALSVQPPVPLELAGYEDGALLLRPTVPLTPGLSFQFVLTPTATDRDGVPLDRAYAWAYHLPPLAVMEGPTRQRPDSPLALYFHYEIDPENARQAVRIEPAIGGEWKWDAEQKALVFHPQERLPAGTTLTVSLSADLCDPDGRPFPPPEPFRWTTPPPILATHPPSGLSIPPETVVRITFDRPMNWETVVAAFSITPTVSGRFEWEETTFIFRPQQPLEPTTLYTVSLAPSALDSTGKPILSQPYTWAFQTGAPSPTADFGWGAERPGPGRRRPPRRPFPHLRIRRHHPHL